VQILSDDQTPELAAVVHRITRQPMEERLKHPKDLGETMVIAHAVVVAESGETGYTPDDGASKAAFTAPGSQTATVWLSAALRLPRRPHPRRPAAWHPHPRHPRAAPNLNVTTAQLTVILALGAEVVSEENWR
jgi:hypothetical protein